MTVQEAEHCLQYGCRHNPWTEDVCGNCAKDVLEVFFSTQAGSSKCRTCGDPTHSTSEHLAWTTFPPHEDNDE